MEGWVYIISNKSFLGQVKVGFTMGDPEKRAADLNHTGVPNPYLVDYQMLIEAPYEIERMAHSILSSTREGKEWFRNSAEEAIAAIKLAAGTGAIREIYKHAERAKAEALHQRELEARELRRRQENEEAEIRQKFDAQIAASFSSGPFWVYWLGGGILVLILLAIFLPKMSSGVFMFLAFLLGAPVGLWLQYLFESKQSRSVVALEKQRDEAFEAVRGRIPSQPTKQEVTESIGNSLVQSQDQIGMERHKKAAVQGIASSQAWLGWMYSNGKNVPLDYLMAHQWYEKAAVQGYARAQNNLGWLYANGQGVPQDYAKAREWFEKAATQGDVLAQIELGRLYFLGKDVPQNYAMARQWFEKAAAQGDANAQCVLGRLYANGQGVPQDYAKAREWFEKAAAQGHAEAQYDLGKLYANGQGMPHDHVEARQWLEKAATQGHVEAQRSLGWMYDKGLSGPRDYAKAREWYEQAAVQGNVTAQGWLGLMYANGRRGMPQDLVQAYLWLSMAAAQGNKMAPQERDKVVVKMTPAQLAEAERLAQEWTPKTPRPTDKMPFPRSIGESNKPLLDALPNRRID